MQLPKPCKLKFKFSSNLGNVTEEAHKLENLLIACSSSSLSVQGQQLHAHLLVNGFQVNTGLAARTLGMYILCKRFKDAKKMFYDPDTKWASRTMPWNWMIRGCNELGLFDFSLLFYFKMLNKGTSPDKYTFPPVIKACCGLNNVILGRMISEHALQLGFKPDEYMGSALVKLYAENGYLIEASKLFVEIPQRDTVLWNVMLHGMMRSEELENCLNLFHAMREEGTNPNSATFSCILAACRNEKLSPFTSSLHGLALKHGLDHIPSVANALVSSYSKCGLLIDARKMFDTMRDSEPISWNSMISGYAQKGYMGDAFSLFSSMISSNVKPDETTFTSLLPSLSELVPSKEAKLLHNYIIKQGVTLDVHLSSALIDMYAKFGLMSMSQKIFEASQFIDIVSCTALISGYVTKKMFPEALTTFRILLEQGISPNSLTLTSFLPSVSDLMKGKELHSYTVKKGLTSNTELGSALVTMYAKCRRLDLAVNTFDQISCKDYICYNAMISGCIQNGNPDKAIELFRTMNSLERDHSYYTITIALSAASTFPSLRYGRELHAYTIKNPSSIDVHSQCALIDMYAKCGFPSQARSVFEAMDDKNDVAWNSIVSAYGCHGDVKEALSLFNLMLESKIRPDSVTFLVMMSACGHSGRVNEGVAVFRRMTEEFGMVPAIEHYACVVDLFARGGMVEEALGVIKEMPFEADEGIWGSLLGACRIHGNLEVAEEAAAKLSEMKTESSGYYMLLCNARAHAGKWSDAVAVRRFMKDGCVRKVPGYSWIEVHDSFHVFASSDKTHRFSSHIYSLLQRLFCSSSFLPDGLFDDVGQ